MEFQWKMDAQTWNNHNVMLFYKRAMFLPDSGTYIEIDTKGNVTAGVYNYAPPHITDGEFRATQHILYGDQNLAIAEMDARYPGLILAKDDAEQRLARVRTWY